MSYSVCLFCKKMVYQYEKYCPECEKKHKLKNDPLFWKTAKFSVMEEPQRSQEIQNDKLHEMNE